MKVINYEGLFNLIADAPKNAQPVGLTALTEIAAPKSNPFGKIFKLNRVNAFINFDYEKAVNRKLEKEGHVAGFEASGTYGFHLTPALVSHQNKDFLCAYVKSARPLYMIRDEKTGGLKLIEKSKIEKYLPKENENKLKYRRYNLRNLRRIRINKQDYKIVN